MHFKPYFIGLIAGLMLAPLVAGAAPSKVKNFKDLKTSQLRSFSAAVIDAGSGELLFGKREETEKPVASITKIAGAFVFLSQNPNLNKKVRMESEDEKGGGRLRLPVGTSMRAKDFLYASLVGSANNSATALSRLTDLSKSKFIDEMNRLADSAGASDAKFVDACGISPNNEASAKDLALIGNKVFGDSFLCKVSSTKSYSFNINDGKGTKRIVHTSPIVSKKSSVFKVLAAKTGYLPEVGNNLLVKLQNKKKSKAQIMIVLMGANTQNATTLDASKLGKWAFANYKW
jgi:serine-type D-Ala-D-Ala endopeptidase (penicillin-binding protein 7)